MSSLIQPGDMVRMERTICGIPYTHWGICVGGGDMVHFAPEKSAAGGGELAFKFNSNDPDTKVKILRSNMKLWADGDAYCADNYLDKKHEPRSVGDIVTFALQQVKFCNWEYHLVLRNCEKFAIWCRYRIDSIGDQAKTGLAVAGVAAGIAFLGVAALATFGGSSSRAKEEKDKEYKEERYVSYK